MANARQSFEKTKLKIVARRQKRRRRLNLPPIETKKTSSDHTPLIVKDKRNGKLVTINTNSTEDVLAWFQATYTSNASNWNEKMMIEQLLEDVLSREEMITFWAKLFHGTPPSDDIVLIDDISTYITNTRRSK
jgi:hypothetical protein